MLPCSTLWPLWDPWPLSAPSSAGWSADSWDPEGDPRGPSDVLRLVLLSMEELSDGSAALDVSSVSNNGLRYHEFLETYLANGGGDAIEGKVVSTTSPRESLADQGKISTTSPRESLADQGKKIADSGAINCLVCFDTGASTVCSVSNLELVCFVSFRFWS